MQFGEKGMEGKPVVAELDDAVPCDVGYPTAEHASETASADIVGVHRLHGQEAAAWAPPCKKEACLACRKAQLPAACLTALRRIHRRSKARRARGIGVVAAVRAGPVSAHKQRVLGGAALSQD